MAGLATSFRELTGTGEGLFTTLGAAMDKVVTAAGSLSEAFTGAFGKIDAAAAASVRSIEGLTAAMANADRAAAVGRGETILPGPRAPREPREPGELPGLLPYSRAERAEADYLDRDFNLRQRRADGESKERTGIAGGMLAGLAPLAAGVSGYAAEKAAMVEDNAIRNTLIEGFHIPSSDPKFGERMAQMRKLAHEASEGTIYSESQAAMAMQPLARELGITGEPGLELFSNIFRPTLQAAETAQMTGLGDMKGSMSAGIELAHMAGATTDPDKLEHYLNLLRSIAQLTNQTMSGEEKIIKYSLPIGKAAGMSPEEVMIQTGFLQQQGFNSSTAGTGLSQMIIGALDTGGPLTAHLVDTQRKAESELENSLKMKPGEIRKERGKGGSKHAHALEDLHITAGGKLMAVDDAGNFDLGKVEDDIRAYARTHDKAQVLSTLHDAFGTRGERVAATFADPDSDTRLKRFGDAVRTSPTASEIQSDLAKGPLNQFEQVLARISDIGNTLATATLPGLNAMFKATNEYLAGFNTFLKEHQGVATVAGYGALGVATAAAAGLAAKAGGAIWRGTGARAVWRAAHGLMTPAEGAAEGIGESLLTGGGAGGGWTVAGMTVPLAIGAGVAGIGYAAGLSGGVMFDDQGRQIAGPGAFPAPSLSLPGPRVGTTPMTMLNEQGQQLSGPRGATAPASVTVTNNFNGITDIGQILAKLTDALKTALMSASSLAQGHDISPYTQASAGF